MHREVLEEAGVRVKLLNTSPVHTTKVWKHKNYDQHTLVFCFPCKLVKEVKEVKDKKIKLLDWKDIFELHTVDFLQTTKELLKDLVITK